MGELKPKRFNLIFEKHFGIGIRWDDWLYPLELSIAIPFITFTIGIGKIRQSGEPVGKPA